MTEAILKLENIIEILSRPDLSQKDLVLTQEINQICDALRNAKSIMDEQQQQQLEALILRAKARISELHNLTNVSSLQLAVLMRLGKVVRSFKHN